MSNSRSTWPLPEQRMECGFEDAKPLYTDSEAHYEANRCLYCFDAPCIVACPTSIDIPAFIRKIATQNVRGSAKTILSANMLGVSCARVCPVDVLCVGACVYNDLNKQPIAIGRLQRYATENALDNEQETGRKLFPVKPKTGKKVALIGAGPASLACAAHLTIEGAEAVIFERGKLPGGLNTTGVAPYKLDSESSLSEVDWLLSHGATLKTGVTVGKDITVDDLLKEYDAVFVGIGLGPDRSLLGGTNRQDVWGATDLIAAIKNDGDYRLPDDVYSAIVVGGGNTGIDIARELAMMGLPEVRMVYRRSEEEMSGYRHEMDGARHYGVQLVENCSPKEILREDGKLVGVRFKGPEGENVDLQCDLVVEALGQLKWANKLGIDINTNDNGTIAVDPKRRTSREGVYAGGDCINGGKEVVNAAADGREAAFAMLASWRDA